MRRVVAVSAMAFMVGCTRSCDSPPAPSTVSDRGGPETPALPAAIGAAKVEVRCPRADARALTVGPHLFGVAFADEPETLYAQGHRWGGNTTSRYNFMLGNAWNTGADWFYRNVEIDSVSTFVKKAKVREPAGTFVAITVPMLGWVAKDVTSGSFPVPLAGAQDKVAPERPDLGNGLAPNKKKLTPLDPTTANVRVAPADVGAWVAKLEREEPGVTHQYILDNEPSLWSSTHRDVHPEPETYDELIEKTLAYARAIRAAAPKAEIAGPAEWGWPGYFYSAKDAAAGFRLRPDRRSHGDIPKLAYYIQKLKAEEDRTKERLVDVIDLHFYPQAEGVQGPDGEGGDGGGDVDPKTNALRLRATRALWDPSYKDESYIDEPIYLLPRVTAMIVAENPMLHLQIGEMNFGGERHISGGLALAEALGRIAEAGVLHAFYWKAPKADSPAWFAMRAYTNYDGRGGAFEGELATTKAPVGVSAYAVLRDHVLVMVLLNFDDTQPKEVNLTLTDCAANKGGRVFTYDGKAPAFTQSVAAEPVAANWKTELPPSSITVVELVE